MDQPTRDDAPRRKGVIETIKGFIADVVGATRTRVDDFSAEVQHRAVRLLWMLIWTLVAATSLWLAVCFAMLTVIFGFGLPPKYAFGIPALVFLVVGLTAVWMFRRAKFSKRPAR
jgi:uncharacterized membrane protein YqjE